MAAAIGSLLRTFLPGDQQSPMSQGRRALTARGAKPRVTRSAPARREERLRRKRRELAFAEQEDSVSTEQAARTLKNGEKPLRDELMMAGCAEFGAPKY